MNSPPPPLETPDGVESRAAIARHPIHPFLVVFPIASLVGALAADLAFLAGGDPFWARAAFILLGTGLLTGLLAGLVGAIDYAGIAEVRRLRAAHLHAGGNILALLLTAANMGVRLESRTAIEGAGLLLSIAVVLILGVTGWLGGELSYRHRIGVMPRR